MSEPVNEYKDYLSRSIRTSTMTMYEAHQLAISREIAKWYGVTNEQIKELDELLRG